MIPLSQFLGESPTKATTTTCSHTFNSKSQPFFLQATSMTCFLLQQAAYCTNDIKLSQRFHPFFLHL
jgi:hypothetical protein